MNEVVRFHSRNFSNSSRTSQDDHRCKRTLLYTCDCFCFSIGPAQIGKPQGFRCSGSQTVHTLSKIHLHLLFRNLLKTIVNLILREKRNTNISIIYIYIEINIPVIVQIQRTRRIIEERHCKCSLGKLITTSSISHGERLV